MNLKELSKQAYYKDEQGILLVGDCVEWMSKIPDETINLTVTSPPYDNLRTYEGYEFDFEGIAQELYRITKSGGVVVWVVGDETKDFCESLTSHRQVIYFVDNVGFSLLDTMIYEKANGPAPYPTMRRYAPWFEYMFVLTKGKPATFNPIKDRENKRKPGQKNSGTARQKDGSLKKTREYIRPKYSIRSNVWNYSVGKNKDTKDEIALNHPAKFPELLAHDHIISWSNPGDLILDPMCGSGTTCKMAKLKNREYIGIDISENYIKNICVPRLQNLDCTKEYERI